MTGILGKAERASSGSIGDVVSRSIRVTSPIPASVSAATKAFSVFTWLAVFVCASTSFRISALLACVSSVCCVSMRCCTLLNSFSRSAISIALSFWVTAASSLTLAASSSACISAYSSSSTNASVCSVSSRSAIRSVSGVVGSGATSRLRIPFTSLATSAANASGLSGASL